MLNNATMLNTITTKTVRDQRRSLLWWAVGILGFTILLALFFPSIRDNPGIQDYVESFPPELMAFFGGERMALITTPEGYLDAELFSFMLPIMFLVFTVTLGSALIAGEEERGRLEILATEPVSRRRIYFEQAAGLALSSFALTVVLWLGMVVGALLVGMQISVWNLAAASFSLWLMAMAFGAMALAIGGITGKRGLAVGVAAVIGVLMYFINGLSGFIEGLQPLRPLSLFYYYNENFPLANGLDFVHVAVLLLVSVVFTAVGALGFERRDLRV